MKALILKCCLSLSIITLSSCALEVPRNYEPQTVLQAQNYVDAGVLYLEKEDLEQARAAFEVAYDIAPIPSSIDGLGCVAFRLGQYSVAEKLFKRALREGSNYTDSLGNLALLYESRGKLRAAYSYYLEAVKRNPKNFRIRNNFAVFLAEYNVEGFDSKNVAIAELKKAEVLASHPFISKNMNILERN